MKTEGAILKWTGGEISRLLYHSGFSRELISTLLPIGWLCYLISLLRICPRSRIRQFLYPIWIFTLSRIFVRKYRGMLLCTPILRRLTFVAPDFNPLYLYFHIWAVRDYEKVIKPSKGGVVVDVGAHIGLFTLRCLKCHKSKEVVALEPNPYNASLLRINLLMNKLSDRVVIIEAAAGVEEGMTELYLSDESGGHSITNPEDILFAHSKRGILVKTILPDYLLSTHKLKTKTIDFVKVDVAGAEIEVLEGAENILSKFKPLLVTETINKNLAALLTLLRMYGYEITIFPYGDKYHLSAAPVTQKN